MSENELPIGSCVELKDGREEVYRFAVAGSRGWIRDRREDEYGFPQVYIEWDKDHWKYSGETDGWTFADHFITVTGEDKGLLDDAREKAEQRREAEKGTCPDCGEIHDKADEIEKYLEALRQGMDKAIEADGFMLITINRAEALTSELVYAPQIHTGALTQIAATLLEAQVVHIAAMAHQDHAFDLLNRLIDEGRDD